MKIPDRPGSPPDPGIFAFHATGNPTMTMLEKQRTRAKRNARRNYMRYVVAAISAIVMLFVAAPGGQADLHALADRELAGISGVGGLSIGMDDVSVYVHFESISYTDTDSGNALVLEGVTLSGGNGGPVTFATGDVEMNDDRLRTPLTLDVGNIGDQAAVVLQALDWQQDLNLHVNSLSFCGQELGSLDIGAIHRPSFTWMVAGHGDGIDFELAQRLSIDTLQYTCSDTDEQLTLTGIHLGARDDGAPEDPTTWQMSGTFQLGDMTTGHPAAFDVGQDENGMAAIQLSLPMSGAMRVENLQWGGTDFGPMAIDGIVVHRLSVQLIP